MTSLAAPPLAPPPMLELQHMPLLGTANVYSLEVFELHGQTVILSAYGASGENESGGGGGCGALAMAMLFNSDTMEFETRALEFSSVPANVEIVSLCVLPPRHTGGQLMIALALAASDADMASDLSETAEPALYVFGTRTSSAAADGGSGDLHTFAYLDAVVADCIALALPFDPVLLTAVEGATMARLDPLSGAIGEEESDGSSELMPAEEPVFLVTGGGGQAAVFPALEVSEMEGEDAIEAASIIPCLGMARCSTVLCFNAQVFGSTLCVAFGCDDGSVQLLVQPLEAAAHQFGLQREKLKGVEPGKFGEEGEEGEEGRWDNARMGQEQLYTVYFEGPISTLQLFACGKTQLPSLLVTCAAEISAIYLDVVERGLDGQQCAVLPGSRDHDSVLCGHVMEDKITRKCSIFLGTFDCSLLRLDEDSSRSSRSIRSGIDSVNIGIKGGEQVSTKKMAEAAVAAAAVAEEEEETWTHGYTRAFTEPVLSIQSADLTGDGLSELVVLTNHSVHVMQYDLQVIAAQCEAALSLIK